MFTFSNSGGTSDILNMLQLFLLLLLPITITIISGMPVFLKREKGVTSGSFHQITFLTNINRFI